MTGYDLRALARVLGKGLAALTLRHRSNRGKSFDQLWTERASWVRLDLCDMAGMPNGGREAVKARLLELCREHNVPVVTVPEVSR